VVGAAAVFIVCQRSPAPVRDQGESNLVLWPIFLPFSPSLLSFHLHPCTDPPLDRSRVPLFFSRWMLQKQRWVPVDSMLQRQRWMPNWTTLFLMCSWYG
jgi:hypothetical protein